MANVALYRDLPQVFAGAVSSGVTGEPASTAHLGCAFAGILPGPFTPGPRIIDVEPMELLAEAGPNLESAEATS